MSAHEERGAAKAPAKGRRTGRRPGDTGTREAIRRAAAQRFSDEGFQATTVRAIAADAGVDPALVIHYFGSKQGLFEAAMQFPEGHGERVEAMLAGGADGLGRRLAGMMLQLVDELGAANPMLGLLRSATTDAKAARMLREFFAEVILTRLTSTLDIDRPELRAELCASQLLGASFARQLLELPSIVATPRDLLAEIYGETLQRYLTGPLPEAVHPM